MLNLVLFILVVCFMVCTISGVIGFFTDLRNFKAEHEFSGNRKQLIEFSVKMLKLKPFLRLKLMIVR